MTNRRLIVYKKFNTIHQKIDQKVNVFKIYLKEIKRKLFFFNEYHKVMLFLAKLISVLKNILFIMKDVLNIRETILSKIITQEIILSRTRENDNNSNNQHKNNKFSNNKFSRNQ